MLEQGHRNALITMLLGGNESTTCKVTPHSAFSGVGNKDHPFLDGLLTSGQVVSVQMDAQDHSLRPVGL